MHDPNTLFRRRALAVELEKAGFPVAHATLATLACRGGGPIFQKFGRYPLYRWDDALVWARSRLSQPVGSTSELDGLRHRDPWPAN